MLNYNVFKLDWATLAHISNQDTSRGYPQARVFSVVDGPVFNSTGVPYVYAPLVDEGVRDLIVPNNTLEWVFARDALFSQHPIMAKWPLAHNWLVIRLNIINIILVDNFGGNKYPSVSDYFHATPDNYDNVRESRPTDNHYEPQTNEDGLDDQIEVVEVLNYI
ncbi:hypothetical protein AAG570_000425 [Ranatra chinensis]|uniref:CREG-like beta-barrel domain-containing protein n=1 Tax=Ranatra chinensis TaxID=642074 RepID=A0ABD0YWZ9_9HEMI